MYSFLLICELGCVFSEVPDSGNEKSVILFISTATRSIWWIDLGSPVELESPTRDPEKGFLDGIFCSLYVVKGKKKKPKKRVFYEKTPEKGKKVTSPPIGKWPIFPVQLERFLAPNPLLS